MSHCLENDSNNFKNFLNARDLLNSPGRIYNAKIDQCKNNQKSKELDIKTVKDTTAKLYESVVDLKARSMRDNLIFTGIPEQRWEDTEQVLQNFSRISTSLITESILKGYTG